jgi:hypothetical protein
VVGVETRVGAVEAQVALEQQPGRHQQGGRAGELRHHQRVTEPPLAPGGQPRALAHRLVARPEGLQRRTQAAHHAAEQRQGEHQAGGAEVELGPACGQRGQPGRPGRGEPCELRHSRRRLAQRGGGGTGQQQTADRAEQRQQQPLGEQLADDAAAAAAQGGAQVDLALPRGGTRPQQVGRGDAGEQPQQRCRRQQQARAPRPARPDPGRRQRLHTGAPALVGLGMEAGGGGGNCRQVGSRLADRHAGPQPRQHLQAVVIAGAAGRRRPDERHPESDSRRRREPGRHHAGDAQRHAVEPQGAADDLGIGAEAPPPERMRQHRHAAVAAGCRHGGGKASPQQRLAAEQRQQRGGGAGREHALGRLRRRPGAGQVGFRGLEGGDAGKAPAEAAPVGEVGHRSGEIDAGRADLAQAHQAGRLGERQRAQHRARDPPGGRGAGEAGGQGDDRE